MAVLPVQGTVSAADTQALRVSPGLQGGPTGHLQSPQRWSAVRQVPASHMHATVGATAGRQWLHPLWSLLAGASCRQRQSCGGTCSPVMRSVSTSVLQACQNERGCNAWVFCWRLEGCGSGCMSPGEGLLAPAVASARVQGCRLRLGCRRRRRGGCCTNSCWQD